MKGWVRSLVLRAKILGTGMLILMFVLCILLIGEAKEGEKEYEILAGNNEGEITEEFLRQVSELEGVSGVSAIIHIPVHLKIEGYEQNIVLKGIDFNTYPMRIKECEKDLRVGSEIPLFLGSGSLDGFLDINGRVISNKVKKDLFHRGIGLKFEIKAMGSEPDKPEQSTILPLKRAGIWAAVTWGDKDEIYISLEDCKELAEDLGLEKQVKEIYIRVKGKKNYQNVKQSLGKSGLI